MYRTVTSILPAQHVIDDGDMHLLHAEQPLSGRHGLQLWISLPPDMKLVEPTYTSLPKANIPELTSEGSRVHVIAGRVNGAQGPMGLTGGAVFARVRIDAGAASLEVEAGLELGVYVLQGEVDIDGTVLSKGMLGNLDDGTRIVISAMEAEPVELALLGGLPVQGEVLFAGPFVMDTPERLAQAKRDFAQGKMGRLEGVPF